MVKSFLRFNDLLVWTPGSWGLLPTVPPLLFPLFFSPFPPRTSPSPPLHSFRLVFQRASLFAVDGNGYVRNAQEGLRDLQLDSPFPTSSLTLNRVAFTRDTGLAIVIARWFNGWCYRSRCFASTRRASWRSLHYRDVLAKFAARRGIRAVRIKSIRWEIFGRCLLAQKRKVDKLEILFDIWDILFINLDYSREREYLYFLLFGVFYQFVLNLYFTEITKYSGALVLMRIWFVISGCI